jgi:hypothetical protein
VDQARLRIEAGPRAGETRILDPQEPFTIGRSPVASLCLDAASVSRQHCELLWDGRSCRIRDLQSRNGVFVNDRPVTETVLRSGDRVRLGECSMLLEIGPSKRRLVEESEPAVSSVPTPANDNTEETIFLPAPILQAVEPLWRDAPVQAPAAGTASEALRRACAIRGQEQLVAVVDGAQLFELAFAGRMFGLRTYTLFSGDLAGDLAHVGPVVVELARPAPFLAKWADAIGRHAGIILLTRSDLQQVYQHLRSIFIVKDEEGQEFFFRFYDPRVLRTFLPTCTPDELREFFGAVARWVVEREDATGYIVYERSSDGQLVTQEVPLDTQDAAPNP